MSLLMMVTRAEFNAPNWALPVGRDRITSKVSLNSEMTPKVIGITKVLMFSPSPKVRSPAVAV